MIYIQTPLKLEVGKIYGNDGTVTSDDKGNWYSLRFLVIKEATMEEFIAFVISYNPSKEDLDNIYSAIHLMNFYKVMPD